MPVSALSKHDELVTCVSCHFRYARVRGFCPRCGETAPPFIAKARGGTSRGVYHALAQAARRAIPALLCAILLFFAWPLWRDRERTIRGRQDDQIASPPVAVQPQPAELLSPDSRVQAAAQIEHSAKTREAEPQAPREIDPAVLWNQVTNGSVNAEVVLAKLYLDGKGVEQSCEQAHQLLLAAAKKRSRAAIELLSGNYRKRCRD